jgi:hypothetical protein
MVLIFKNSEHIRQYLMNRFKSLITFLLLMCFVVSCEKEPSLSNAKEIKEFVIEASLNNDVLKKDIEGVIERNRITLYIPKEIDITSLIASFNYSGKEIIVGSQQQASAVTINNFSEDLIYTVIAEDGSQFNYHIKVEAVEDMGLLFKSFSFNEESNSILDKDYQIEINENELTGKIKSNNKILIPTFETEAITVSVNGEIQESGKTEVDFTNPVVYTLTSEYGSQKEYIVELIWTTGLPHLFIVTEGNAPINSKENYVKATLKLDGAGIYEDYEGTTGIRGRGNSTWSLPKKPYRLKLDSKAPLLGLSAEKDWILLANYLDETLMLNAVASKTAKLLEMPYTNTMIPVDVTINGEYIGNYMFTEHKEVETNRIDVTNDGVLLELDTYYDEPWKFRSDNYNLPVMIAYPELEDYPIEDAEIERDKIKADFQLLEDAVFDNSFPNNNYLDYIDKDALVNYLLVYNLTQNQEINHPKSTYIHKQKEGKYMMGPIWDFDWAFDFNGNDTHFGSYSNPLFIDNGIGSQFFSRFLEDPVVQEAYRQKWASFKTSKLPELLTYIDNYADLIELSHELNYEKWQRGSGNFRNEVQNLRTWVENRASYIDDYVNSFN